jgi:hypothetical protein
MLNFSIRNLLGGSFSIGKIAGYEPKHSASRSADVQGCAAVACYQSPIDIHGFVAQLSPSTTLH